MQPGVSDSPSLGKGRVALLKYVGSEGVPPDLTPYLSPICRAPEEGGQPIPELSQGEECVLSLMGSLFACGPRARITASLYFTSI